MLHRKPHLVLLQLCPGCWSRSELWWSRWMTKTLCKINWVLFSTFKPLQMCCWSCSSCLLDLTVSVHLGGSGCQCWWTARVKGIAPRCIGDSVSARSTRSRLAPLQLDISAQKIGDMQPNRCVIAENRKVSLSVMAARGKIMGCGDKVKRFSREERRGLSQSYQQTGQGYHMITSQLT